MWDSKVTCGNSRDCFKAENDLENNVWFERLFLLSGKHPLYYLLFAPHNIPIRSFEISNLQKIISASALRSLSKRHSGEVQRH